MRVVHWILMLAIWMALPAPAGAQTQITTAGIEGVVVDASGGVLPGVMVEVRNVGTNLTRTLQTDMEGRFNALQLPPGIYKVTFTLSGFATLVQDGVVVNIGQSLRLSPTMRPSNIAETVNVTAQATTVDTGRTAAASTLDETTIGTTPILGRKFEDLLSLTPGVSIVQGPDGDEITFSGQRGVFNNISLDGGDFNNGFFGEQVGGQRAAIDVTLDAVKEFQVVATGANAEFGRTAGGVVNVITKSGTNQTHGSLFHYQRLEGLTSNTSDGKPLADFHREQFGGTAGGPIVKDKVFYFGAIEGIRERLLRPNLSEAIGTPCPVASPTLAANEALINSSADCQRVALINFFKTSRGQDEGQPVAHTVNNGALLGKIDWATSARNNLSVSYNFNYSKNENQTFDVATYGTSANGTEGPSKINLLNANLFTTVTSTRLNEFHVTVSRESRPRSATSVQHSRGYGHRVRALVPLRQPVLRRAQRGRAREALPGEGQLHHRPRRPYHQDRRGVAAHQQRPGVPRLLRGTLPLRQRRRVPALRVAGGGRRVWPEHDRLLERDVRHGARNLSRGNHDDRRTAAVLSAEQQP